MTTKDPYEAARKALADYDAIDGWNGTHAVMIANADALASALRALITPLTQKQMLDRLGIRYTESVEQGYVYIPLQMIEREDS